MGTQRTGEAPTEPLMDFQRRRTCSVGSYRLISLGWGAPSAVGRVPASPGIGGLVFERQGSPGDPVGLVTDAHGQVFVVRVQSQGNVGLAPGTEHGRVDGSRVPDQRNRGAAKTISIEKLNPDPDPCPRGASTMATASAVSP